MPLQIPHPNSPLHLYRHLLREATYLPPIIRPWATIRVKERFRECRHDTERSEKYTKQAHHQLRYLRAANAGHVQRMQTLLYKATGRLGRRRRELAAAYLKKEPPVDSAALENDAVAGRYVLEMMQAVTPQAGKTKKTSRTKTQTDENKVPMPPALEQLQAASAKEDGVEGQRAKINSRRQVGRTWLEDWDFAMIQSLAEAQRESQTGIWPNEVRRTVDPKGALPMEDCWGRPLTLKPKLFTNKLKKFWVPILSKIMPPLPQGEWDLLKALTLGEADDKTWSIPTRRPLAVGASSDGKAVVTSNGKALWDWEKYATRSVGALERPNARKRKILSGGLDEDPRGQGRPTKVRTFRPRALRRIYGLAWTASPLMQRSPNGKWHVTWGNGETRLSTPLLSDSEFFEGVDKKGSPVRSEVHLRTHG